MTITSSSDHLRIRLAGGSVECLDIAGEPRRAPVVLLHEGLGSLGLWRRLPRTLAERTGCRVVAYSRLGHGASDPPPALPTSRFMHKEALEALPALFERLEIDRPVLVGHSDGASIALIHAAAQPVRGLALIAPHVFVEETTLKGIRRARAAFRSGELEARMARHHRDPEITFRAWSDAWLSPRFRSWNIEGALRAISAPVLLVQGRDDEYGSLAQLDAIERGVAGPTERLVVAGGHAPHLDNADEVVPALVAFIERVAGAS